MKGASWDDRLFGTAGWVFTLLVGFGAFGGSFYERAALIVGTFILLELIVIEARIKARWPEPGDES